MTIARISSRQNALVAQYRRVGAGDDPSLVLLDGVHLVAEALAAGVSVHDVMVTDEARARSEVAALLEQLRHSGVPVVAATSAVVAAASPVRSPSGIVALAVRPADKHDDVYKPARPLVLVAHSVQDPGNVGAIVRVAEAAGASGVVATGACADPFGWKALRGSMGSALRVPIGRQASVEDAVAEARRHGCTIVVTVPRGGRSIFETDLARPVAVVIGGEGGGLPPTVVDAADERVSIPMAAPVESLNTAAAAAVVLYEARRQRYGFAVS